MKQLFVIPTLPARSFADIGTNANAIIWTDVRS